MHIAIMGGTFNPVHYGHLRVSEEVREAFSLEKVMFIPTSITPHKDTGEAAIQTERLEMIKLAIKDNPGLDASDIEIKRGGRSYTIDTIKALRKEKDHEFYLIVGSDSFNDIVTWREYERLFDSVNFIIVPRPGFPAKKIGEVLPVELAGKFWYDSGKDNYRNPSGHTISYMQTTRMDISSSDIRTRVREGLSIRYLVPPEVEEYILMKGLYK